MPRLDELPPDLRATLSLLVDRGKSYAEVAELLGISEAAVRDRAHAALDRLAGAPEAPRYVSVAGAEPSGALAPGTGDPSSAGPGGGGRAGRARLSVPKHSGGGPSSTRGAGGLPASRRGGAALLAGIAVVIVIVVVLVTTGGGSGAKSGGGSGTTGATGATGASGSAKSPTVTNQLTLTAPNPASKAIGIVEVLAEKSQHAFYMAAEHLAPSNGFKYVVWLYNSPNSAEAVSKATVGSNGRLQGGALLPANAGDYRQILLTREHSEHPAHPGPIALQGAFSLAH
jgi:hypothetical protein